MTRDDSNEGWPCEDCGRAYVHGNDPCPYCELVRLHAIVDKLPKTADGVSITHLAELFTTQPMEFPNGALLQGRNGRPLAFIVALSATNGAKVNWSHVYSTREAAEQARKSNT